MTAAAAVLVIAAALFNWNCADGARFAAYLFIDGSSQLGSEDTVAGNPRHDFSEFPVRSNWDH